MLLFSGVGALPAPCSGQETELQYLSGTGLGDQRPWEFRISHGRRSGSWTEIPVPSQWELEGFGEYLYGFDGERSPEVGEYRLRFRVPASWRGRQVDLVFEGVMTDTEVRLNGQAAGAVHQGGFTPFAHEVSELLDFDGENLLEVRVAEDSAQESVHLAERQADYWLFGGIYRPVYLRALPAEAIEAVAIDARHSGELTIEVEPRGLGGPAEVTAWVENMAGERLGELSATAEPDSVTRLRGSLPEIDPWSAESPHLYRLRVRLSRAAEPLHELTETFGFRTVEVRPGDGLYINGQKVRLKGINRHSFWPDSGRTLNRQLNEADARLIRAMHMNAVRTSHYPPDRAFLEACDRLGLYVLDELPGWHDAYSTAAGRPLIRAMVRRDRNHPSVIFWNHGNEGGWNPDNDGVFHLDDPQKRPIFWPDSVHGAFDSIHYLSFEELQKALGPPSFLDRLLHPKRPPLLVLPTEILHGLYDGGHGAGLAEYWRQLMASPRGIGLFLWTFVDEGVVRTDRGGELDTFGNYAPDGIVGPYREKEGSFYTVRRLWSPVQIPLETLGPGFDGRLPVVNRFDMTGLDACRFRWRWLALPPPGEPAARLMEVAPGGEGPGPSVGPWQEGHLAVGPPAAGSEALEVRAFGPDGEEILRWVLPLTAPRQEAQELLARRPQGPLAEAATSRRVGAFEELAAGSVVARFDLASGELVSLQRDGRAFPLGPGPRRASGQSAELAASRTWTEGPAAYFEASYRGGLARVRWRLEPSGWLRLSYLYELKARESELFGVGFPLAEEHLEGFRWLGEGPSRVWRNRTAGGLLEVWERQVNDAITGEHWTYPEAKGAYGGVRWADLLSADQRLTLAFEGEGLYLGLFHPDFPAEPRDATAPGPVTDLSLLHGIPAIGTKFHTPAELGPPGEPYRRPGLYRGSVWFYLQGREGASVAAPVPSPPAPLPGGEGGKKK